MSLLTQFVAIAVAATVLAALVGDTTGALVVAIACGLFGAGVWIDQFDREDDR